MQKVARALGARKWLPSATNLPGMGIFQLTRKVMKTIFGILNQTCHEQKL